MDPLLRMRHKIYPMKKMQFHFSAYYSYIIRFPSNVTHLHHHHNVDTPRNANRFHVPQKHEVSVQQMKRFSYIIDWSQK
jgi:hypothetical protein